MLCGHNRCTFDLELRSQDTSWFLSADTLPTLILRVAALATLPPPPLWPHIGRMSRQRAILHRKRYKCDLRKPDRSCSCLLENIPEWIDRLAYSSVEIEYRSNRR